TLNAPVGPPPGTEITEVGEISGNVPVVYWNQTLTLTTVACALGTVSYEISVGGNVVRSGEMTEAPTGSGFYTATIAPLYPEHGSAVTRIVSTCPGPDNAEHRFDIYIDPSGRVVDARGRPVAGATVTLLRSDSSDGPFEVVAEGDAVMSPAN